MAALIKACHGLIVGESIFKKLNGYIHANTLYVLS